MARRKLQPPARTHYEVMGVTRTTSDEGIKAAWRKLSRELHPDRLGGTPEANARFAEVSAAYATLSDPKARKVYDASIDVTTTPCTTCNGEGKVYKQKGFTGRIETKCPDCNGMGRQR
jgi:DnaJ-class molecular chaperone